MSTTPTPAQPTDAATDPGSEERLLRIHEVAAEIGTTTRSVRYYEEIGLLRPAARSGGDYRLYDQSDLERLRHIRDLRDTAGFSLAEIAQLLEDEDHRTENRAAYRATEDPAIRADILVDSIERAERGIELLKAKEARLHDMVAEAEARLVRLRAKLADVTETRPTEGVAR
jgi:DNA-binding transcriptional MerR regulator